MPVSYGTYVSGAGHLALLIWLLAGWGLSSDPLEFEITEVTVVSGESFEALVRATSPQPSTEVPTTPVAPVVEEAPAVEAPQQDAAPEVVQPDVTEAPAEETPPPAQPEPPTPPAEVTDTAPQPPQPEVLAGAPDLPVSARPQVRQADRVADTPVAPPPPDVETAPVEQAAVAEDAEQPSEQETVVQEQAAPEETTTEIVTEAETPAGAPDTSPRPAVRPSRPVPAPQTETAQAEETPAADTTDAEAEELAALLAGGSQSSAPATATASGPPLSGSEQEAFRLAVSSCWSVDPGAEWARVVVTVEFDLTPEGKVDGDVRFVSATGGTDNLAQTAFQTARRAVMICGARGFNLPADKYDHWKQVVLTFDPATMRLR